MKNTFLQTLLLIVAFSASALADYPESEYKSASLFLHLLGVTNASFAGNTNCWTAPQLFISATHTTNTVSVNRTIPISSGCRFAISCESIDGSGVALLNVCTNAYCALQEISLSCVAFSSMPIELMVAGYTSQTHENGLVEIMETDQTTELAMMSFGNVSVRFEGPDARNRALALLRAGGVEIPDETPPEP